MINKHRNLQDDVRRIFERACDEQDLEIAELLLQELEIYLRREGDSDELQRVCLKIASSLYH